jgi:hypothetical protein
MPPRAKAVDIGAEEISSPVDAEPDGRFPPSKVAFCAAVAVMLAPPPLLSVSVPALPFLARCGKCPAPS